MNNNNQLKEMQDNALTEWAKNSPMLAQRGIDESTWNALCTTIYPGAKPDSVIMAVDYCKARGLDIMLKPVHLVPMNVKDAQTGQYGWRDVPMPGIGMYRIQADRSGTYAGADEPEFGDLVKQTFTDKSGKQVEMEFPEYCKFTVYKLVGDRIVGFTAKEYWMENYATDSSKSDAPNAMWKKRKFGQIAKCAEAQALRKAWPEIGSDPTAEEMEGKGREVEINPVQQEARSASKSVDPNQAHKAITGKVQRDDAELKDSDIKFGKDENEQKWEPCKEASDFGDRVYDCKSKKEFEAIGKEISEAVYSGKITPEEANWLRPMMKEVKPKFYPEAS